jgi:hypothetical protein
MRRAILPFLKISVPGRLTVVTWVVCVYKQAVIDIVPVDHGIQLYTTMANFIEHDDHRDVHEAPITPSYYCNKNAVLVEQWVPSQNPSKWIIINASLSLYSFITACSIIVALRENGEKPVAATLYTCFGIFLQHLFGA